MQSSNKFIGPLGLLIIILVVAVGGYYLYINSTDNRFARVPNTKPSSEIAVSGQFGKSTSVSKALPTQFPPNIPIETGNITENYKVAYNSAGLTQYTVSYTSSKTKTALWNTYNTYMKANNYVLNTKLTSQTKGTLSGTLASASLVVVISTTPTGSLVHLTYIVK